MNFSAPLLAWLLAANVSAATIQFQLADLGGTLHRYNYFVSGFTFQQNQELDISFDPALYGPLTNGVAPSSFDMLLLQPNNPLGAQGLYSALALVNNPSLTGSFGVDFTFLGSGKPGSQPFTIGFFDQGGMHVIQSGLTTPLIQNAVPESTSLSLGSVGLFMGAVLWVVRRRPCGTA